MKYNSNMKNFKPVVLKNLFAMCGRDEKIPALAKDGSPAPLREHLKGYGKTLKVDNGNDIMYDFFPSRGIKIWLDRQIYTDGDNCLELSVSQMATFIRRCVENGSWMEPDCGENSEPEPPEDTAPGKTFLDVFREHYPELDGIPDEELVEEFCYNNFFDVMNDYGCDCNHCSKCWKSDCNANFQLDKYAQRDLEDFMKEYNVPADGEAVPAERDTQITEVSEMSENKIVPAGGSVPDDYQNATLLDAQIKASAAAAAANFEQLAFSLKEMRDGKRYKELGYNSFEEYCKQSLGITDRYARDIISILSLPPEYRNSSSGFGIKKLVLLAGITAEQREQIAQNIDIKDASNNDLKAEIKALKDKNKTLKDDNERKDAELDENKKRLEWAEHNEQEAIAKSNQLEDERQRLSQELASAEIKNSKLENQVKELESRPVEVATKEVIVPDPADKEKISALEKRLEQAETAGNGKRPEQLVKDFYETLHGTALSALQECANFAEKPENSVAARYMAERFKSLIEVINMHLEDLEV